MEVEVDGNYEIATVSRCLIVLDPFRATVCRCLIVLAPFVSLQLPEIRDARRSSNLIMNLLI